MGPQKFVATNTTEALKLVRLHVGADAMVLSTRDVPEGVEIVAISPADLNHMSQSRAEPAATSPPQAAAKTGVQFSPTGPANPGAWPSPPAGRQGFDTPSSATTTAAASSPSPAGNSADLHKLLEEFNHVKQLLQTHLSTQAWTDMQSQSSDQAEALRLTLNAGFSPQLCADLAQAMKDQPGTGTVAEQLQKHLEPRVRTLDPLNVFDPGGIFAFIGPTGVGKTTAIAKIAARCVLRYGREQIALLTTDTFRIGAQEQLKVYAKIIGVPVVSLRDSDDLAAKLNSMGDRRVILLDTAGVSQRDIQMLEQSQLLQQGAPALKRILVMSSTTDLRTQEDVILMHQQAARKDKAHDLLAAIITKTDEAAQLGPVLDCLVRHQLPLMFLANGQRVPEDLSQANVSYLAYRALHPRMLSDRMQIATEQVPALLADQLSQWMRQTS